MQVNVYFREGHVQFLTQACSVFAQLSNGDIANVMMAIYQNDNFIDAYLRCKLRVDELGIEYKNIDEQMNELSFILRSTCSFTSPQLKLLSRVVSCYDRLCIQQLDIVLEDVFFHETYYSSGLRSKLSMLRHMMSDYISIPVAVSKHRNVSRDISSQLKHFFMITGLWVIDKPLDSQLITLTDKNRIEIEIKY